MWCRSRNRKDKTSLPLREPETAPTYSVVLQVLASLQQGNPTSSRAGNGSVLCSSSAEVGIARPTQPCFCKSQNRLRVARKRKFIAKLLLRGISSGLGQKSFIVSTSLSLGVYIQLSSRPSSSSLAPSFGPEDHEAGAVVPRLWSLGSCKPRLCKFRLLKWR
jgi:hypothetical protein